MKRLVILGGGESGVGTALLGKQKGFEVFVSDKGTIAEKYKKVLLEQHINFEENKHTESAIFNADIVMKSPGIPDKIALIQALILKGIKVVSEIEFAAKYTAAKIIGITGSNGKTTTTLLTGHLLKNAGLNVCVGGNIGDSFAQLVAEKSPENYVLELSSFQLDGIIDFSPHIAIITNISPDHLDRYDYKYENYINSKFRITKNQKATDFLIYDADDKAIESWLSNNHTAAQKIPFSIERELTYGAFLRNDTVILKVNSSEEKKDEEAVLIKIDKLALKGKHNIKNAMSAAITAKLLAVSTDGIAKSLSNFKAVEHRLEYVEKINGVQFINDSKATNVNAVFYALECVKTPIIWVVGGVDKGNDYTELLPFVKQKVKAIVCLGENNQKIIETFDNIVTVIIETKTADKAVAVASKLANSGDTVLLSPACASFDLFKNYQDRGTKFKEAIKNL
ncbi:UDP-N-acetylmuramoyl-L-alanine--D-glutamate ligase [Tenacibaculum finnmarkense]|uniref:UDP-N-acetylmuramoylalanine--D-glutamate ligase n=1 Tax=Tenacibaculum finnmarkense genomovar ulcerans TaxID=2781388 RepID=A0A2I2M9U4_9FLAO|nr:UDP-N-acetylmuramoyl-L-alanine--D-glutamate ligase [Tenacibaculum finnmarkense]ALU74002.1 UDP-N-acetylmuramoylalanine--D-glutamate ligase [Tenacibaculum dicentrarchi]MBE7688926.1 UDP-N-acetylmuramoyl-L-alanine--D-glutamate ligase [Tenacibaculum finnmarkense genomovar ulcerans]MBE7697934.1 UDP-N-acetylmuramoyl-L-alanine--D-glutamate ligase [Tenacibaculum finnmarkense genomovar ulcerans]MCG8237260.1 UDP-N-acetylmuramoyl-L-alanine--D-glutamate ligase [Tenacibaculum finnmarkense genomovar ulcera